MTSKFEDHRGIFASAKAADDKRLTAAQDLVNAIRDNVPEGCTIFSCEVKGA